ncbi:protein EURL homolog [Pristis pectinata]|uniref:protein EURL homolog n=1 Tax=Pristis pectinata TaxID=685728 RepID=UPI00223D39E7|nr:protein EURL homolog [Pristis pectinata]
MNEEQFVNIDLNDDDICGVCKLETAKEMLSFCHVCFELSIEGVPRSDLLHTESVRGHRECFEKYHLIANQNLPRSKASKSTYKDVKEILSRKISQIIQYAQNQHLSSSGHTSITKWSQLPRYSPRWLEVGAPGYSECTQGILEREGQPGFGVEVLGADAGGVCSGEARWSTKKVGLGAEGQPSVESRREEAKCHTHYTHEDLSEMSMDDLVLLNEQLVKQIKVVFEDLTQELEKKDSLSSELHVRYIAIEQLFKNRSKLPWLQIGRRGIKPSVPLDN